MENVFHFRNGDYLEAAEPVDGWVHSREIPGFKVHVDWLNPEKFPAPADCLASIAGA